MKREGYLLNRLSVLLNTGIFLVRNGELQCYQDNPECNPLYCCEHLRKNLMEQSDTQTVPYIFKDEYQVFFACIKKPNNSKCGSGGQYYLIGPMSIDLPNMVELHQYYRK